jgi:hypothetical protein
VRRIQIDRDEWLRATRTLRRWIFFWQGVPRTPEAEESLAALLSRREQVRSKQTGPTTTPSPDLFRPVRTVTEVLPGEETSAATTPSAEAPAKEPAKEPEEAPSSTTSRLLEAKRRAQKRKG